MTRFRSSGQAKPGSALLRIVIRGRHHPPLPRVPARGGCGEGEGGGGRSDVRSDFTNNPGQARTPDETGCERQGQEVEGRWLRQTRGMRSDWSQGGRDPSGGAGSRAPRAPHRDCASPRRNVRTPFDRVNSAFRWGVGSAHFSNKLFSEPTSPRPSRNEISEWMGESRAGRGIPNTCVQLAGRLATGGWR